MAQNNYTPFLCPVKGFFKGEEMKEFFTKNEISTSATISTPAPEGPACVAHQQHRKQHLMCLQRNSVALSIECGQDQGARTVCVTLDLQAMFAFFICTKNSHPKCIYGSSFTCLDAAPPVLPSPPSI